ncbi:MAG: hypothetical protein H6978_11580 [Gammaproteobacteria bacterium]|nr:hypothetical protein [Gammaproteobacteria bacterium]
MNTTRSNPWKTTAIVLGAIGLSAVVGVVVAGLNDEPAADEPQTVAQVGTTTTERVIVREPVREDCSVYLAGANRDSGKVVKDGVVGGAIGAGVGAAGGAIADGGDGAAKGAAIGGIVGGIAGALHSNEKQRDAEKDAQRAYDACVARNG